MKSLAFGLILAAGVGCMHIQPVGPLAGNFTPPTSGKGPEKAEDVVTASEPIVRPAPRPTPPTVFVTPAEVTSLNAEEAAKRLGQELDTDRRAAEAMPSPSEISVIKKK